MSCSTSCFATGRSTSCGSLRGSESGRGSTLPACGRADILPGLIPQRFLLLSLRESAFFGLAFPTAERVTSDSSGLAGHLWYFVSGIRLVEVAFL